MSENIYGVISNSIRHHLWWSDEHYVRWVDIWHVTDDRDYNWGWHTSYSKLGVLMKEEKNETRKTDYKSERETSSCKYQRYEG